MKKTELFVISNSFSEEIEMSMVKRGHLDFSAHLCIEPDDIQIGAEKSVIVCKNSEIDSLLAKCKKDGDKLDLLFEQAVTLKREGNEAIFIPIELDVGKFLDEFLDKKEVFACFIFGKSLVTVDEELKRVCSGDYKIFSINSMLHKVFFNNESDLNLAISTFQDVMPTFADDSIENACQKYLTEKGVKISVAGENVWFDMPNVISNFKFVQNVNFLGDDLKQKSFNATKELLTKSEIGVCILQDGEKACAAVGDKKEIHVFATSHIGENLKSFALLKIFKFVEEKYA